MNLFESNKKSEIQTDTEAPDTPIPFGYKTSWIAVKADNPQTVMDRLECSERRVCNWQSAYDIIFGNSQEAGTVFVTPCLDGWVLILNYDEPANYHDMKRLEEIASHFEKVQYYASHRVVDLACWVKFENKELVRAYYYIGESGEVPWNEGALTTDEEEIGLTMLPDEVIEDWDNVTFPDEESVIQLAAKWSVDTTFEKYQGTKSTGFICHMD